jgi:hypothetical protein
MRVMRLLVVRIFAFLTCAALAACSGAEAGSEIHQERAQPAAAFIDSIGVNVHLTYRTGPYGNVSGVESLIHRLGVQHLREGVTLDQPDICTVDRAIAANGPRFDYITQPGLSVQQLASWAACVGPAIESFEGPNEYDISHPASDPDWVSTIRRAQIALYANVKGDRRLARLRVIGPSLTSEKAFRTVGDLSASMDAGNMHNYLAGHEPGTGGWGLDGYGSIAWNVRVARFTDGTKPVWSTENGYSTGGGDPKAIPLDVHAAYVPALYLEQFLAGVPRTYYYELIDEGGVPFGHYGLADGSLQPKPAFRALAGLISLLRDARGTTSTTMPSLRFALDGGDAGTRHLLLARNDGTLALIVWQNESLYDPTLKRTIDPVQHDVQLRLPDGYAQGTVYAPAADDSLRAGGATRSGATIPLSVGPRPLLVLVTPRAP